MSPEVYRPFDPIPTYYDSAQNYGHFLLCATIPAPPPFDAVPDDGDGDGDKGPEKTKPTINHAKLLGWAVLTALAATVIGLYAPIVFG